MIEPLDPNDSQVHRNVNLMKKINEIIEIVNGTYLPATLETTDAVEPDKSPYCPQAEEALKQVAILEHTFDNHHHNVGTNQENLASTSGPIITMVDERETNS